MPEEGVKMDSLLNKCNAKPKKNQKQQKCLPLEPVLEHYVVCLDEVPRKQPQQCDNKDKKGLKGKGILMRLRDGYVKLMNDIASNANLIGMLAMYGCSIGHLDYPGPAAMAFAREVKEEEEMAGCISELQKEITHEA